MRGYSETDAVVDVAGRQCQQVVLSDFLLALVVDACLLKPEDVELVAFQVAGKRLVLLAL